VSFPGITHPLRPPRAVAAAAAPAWPTFKGTATVVGTSSNGVTVYVDEALGSQGMQDAQSLLSSADTVVAQNNAIFGITGGPVDVIVYAIGGATDGTGGADHGGCDFTTGNAIEVDASYGSPEREVALFEAVSLVRRGGQLECTGRFRHRTRLGAGWDAELGRPDRADRPGCGEHRLRHGVHLVAAQPGT
jgi:hypothetical protein